MFLPIRNQLEDLGDSIAQQPETFASFLIIFAIVWMITQVADTSTQHTGTSHPVQSILGYQRNHYSELEASYTQR